MLDFIVENYQSFSLIAGSVLGPAVIPILGAGSVAAYFYKDKKKVERTLNQLEDYLHNKQIPDEMISNELKDENKLEAHNHFNNRFLQEEKWKN